MSFDNKTFQKILASFEVRVARFYKVEKRPPFFRAEKPEGRDEVVVHALDIKAGSMSNHRQILRDRLLDEINDDMQDLDALLRASFPVFDNDLLCFGLESFSARPGERGAKFRFSIRNGGRKASAVLLTTAVERVTLLHDRLGHLPPADHRYLVNDIQIPAATPRDALRVFLALHRPDLFEPGVELSNHAFTVSEIFPVSIEDAISDIPRRNGG